MTTIGPNVIAQTVHDRARLYGWLAQAKPGLIVVCDEIKAGHKVSRAEMVEQIGLVLAEIATLKPPPPNPPPPKVMPIAAPEPDTLLEKTA